MSSTDSAAPLWTVEHPYYCSESNYYAKPGETNIKYASWPEFAESEADNDPDLNLVFRWDWQRKEFIETPEDAAAFDAKYDDNYRAYTLSVFWMGQRKGLFRVTEVDVCRADEPAVREWLASRWEHLRTLWEPLS